ncbi:MAG TPA: hypothetical protein VFI02_22235 [Armatimonadota bacterium]|nr:hypothetical protein [Armatimonadota bacterium]
MRLITVVLSLLAFASIASGQEVSWDKIKPETGEVIPAGGDTSFAQVKMTNTEAKPLAARVITIENPGITQATYAVTGQVRYENVESKGYIEMWSVFPDGRRFFTRTLGTGVLAPLEGSSGWRNFSLPFNAPERPPSKLEISLVLPGKGTVYIGPLALVQSSDISPNGPPRWKLYGANALLLTMQIAYLLLIPVALLTVWLVSKGKARRFVRGMWYVLLSVGILYLSLTGVFVWLGQPGYASIGPLFRGIVITVLSTIALFVTQKYYQRWELRKMFSQDSKG